MAVDQHKKEKLGHLLVQSGLVSPLDIDHALQAQQVFGGTLGTNLVEMGILNDEVLAFFLSKQTGIEKASSTELETIAKDLLSLMPTKATEALCMIPLSKSQNVLTVAMADPTDQTKLKRIEENIGFTLHPKIAPEFQIRIALKKHYGHPLPPRISRLLHQQQTQEPPSNLRKYLDQQMPALKAVETYFKQIQSFEKVPVIQPIEDIKQFKLTPELLFCFQQIDGVSNISDIIGLSVFTKLDTLRILVYFLTHDLIRFEDPL